MGEFLYKDISYIIQGGAYEIYKKFRNRHKELIYQKAFYSYLKKKGLDAEREKRIPIYYEDEKVGTYIPDLVVDDKIFIELKSKKKLIDKDIEQFWYYLKISGYKLGYLINFGQDNGVQIIRRIYDKAREK